MLELKNVYKKYTTGTFTQIALNGVSLKFRKNEFAAILGPSGSGKTTLLNIAGGLAQYDSGDLLINGQTTKEFKDSDWDAYRNNSIGFIFQSYNLISHLTILDNVMMGMTLSGVAKSHQKQRAIEVLNQVGLKDHLHKKPNQLSGGQMQRVAIARSLVNDPDIILADEPTGALDTKTSQQIMALIKEIAKDKLVIMVTHNSELAQEYATRIIEFKDGQLLADSAPYDGEEQSSPYQMKRTSMSYLNALKLSGKNILTKKWRTAMITFASSIGILGVALVLSLSNGFSKQVESIQQDTMSGFPITIKKVSSNMFGSFTSTATEDEQQTFESQQKTAYVYRQAPSEDDHKNKLTDGYIEYLENLNKEWISGIDYTFNVNLNLLHSVNEVVQTANTDLLGFSSYAGTTEDENGFLMKNYDLLTGEYPKETTDLVLMIDENNELSDDFLQAMGLDKTSDKFSFEQFIGQEFKSVLNNQFYEEQRNGTFKAASIDESSRQLYDHPSNLSLKIVGVVRAKSGISVSGTTVGIKYSNQLVTAFLADSINSEIVLKQQGSDYNVTTGEKFPSSTGTEINPINQDSFLSGGVPTVTKEQLLEKFGASLTPVALSIFPTNFEMKEKVLTYLDKWNEPLAKVDQIVYSDLASMITSLMGSTLEGITMVLIAFAGISLFVSLIMIGIITYISVMERTKEIGILRALGARKKDITRVFNAETFIIGAASGLLGIGVAYGLTFPINQVVSSLANISNVAELNPLHAISLVVVSIILTLLGGFIPARMAAKKDPVEALTAD